MTTDRPVRLPTVDFEVEFRRIMRDFYDLGLEADRLAFENACLQHENDCLRSEVAKLRADAGILSDFVVDEDNLSAIDSLRGQSHGPTEADLELWIPTP